MEVLDSTTLTLAGAIADTPGVHGVAIADSLGHGYVSAGATSSVVVFDLTSLARLAEIKTTGDNPDAILYEPIDASRVRVQRTRPQRHCQSIPRKTGWSARSRWMQSRSSRCTTAAGRVFVNLEDRNSLAAIDARTLAVTATWSLLGCEEPTGLAIDRQHHRLFAACSNKVMVIVDSTTGHGVAQVPIGAGVDGAAFDAAEAACLRVRR